MNQVETCNAALRLLARNRINALTDSSAEALVMADIYDVVFADLLTGYPWSFAKTTTESLSKLATETPDERERYPLPSVGWHILARVFIGPSGEEWPYEIEDNNLVVQYDVPSGSLLYATYTTAPNAGDLPSYVPPALVYALAAAAALPLTENNALADRLETLARSKLLNAQYADAASAGQKRLAQPGEYSVLAGR
jgi:hypothetical protein